MKDRFDEKLFLMAGEERLNVPGTLETKIESLLTDLPEKRNAYKVNVRKVIVLAAAIVMLLSVTVTASVGIMRERMEAMNQAKLEEYFNQIYSRKSGSSNYNRYFTDSEKARMETLQIAYKEQGLFPKGELTLIDEVKDYRGKGVAYLVETGTFFFPEEEMSDEHLLQLIDFRYKQDYSLQKMNEMIDAGEVKMSDVLEPEPEVAETDSTILESDAVWDPGQDLTIKYAGDLNVFAMAAGVRDLYLGGWNAVHRMAIGSNTSQVFYDDFEYETRIDGLYVDNAENVYIIGVEFNEEGEKDSLSQIRSWVLCKLDKDGNVLMKNRLGDYSNKEARMIDKMAVDEQGYIYIHVVQVDFDAHLAILDAEGKLVSKVNTDPYYICHIGGLGVGKDGEIYTMIGEKGGQNPNRKGIATVNREESTLSEVYMGIVPDEDIMPKVIIQGIESDFIIWGINGTYSYNLGERSAISIHPAYEAPCSFESVCACALKDGRMVFVPDSAPGETYFYYQSSVKD